ncbi:MAG: VIT domain-containing protein [Isosphaeraceae bacterium]
MSRSLPMIPDAELVPPRLSSFSPADDAAGFGSLRTERGGLPLESMDVCARIDGLLARVVVRQTFVNGCDEPLEAAYIFPLPDRAAVTGFRMTVGGREIDGTLDERAQARRNYDVAIAEGRRAAIAEEDRPGVFNLRVGNILPGERATVELTLSGVLPYSDGEATFRFPLVVAPRYIPGTPLPGASVGDGTAVDTNAVPDASRISPPVLLPGFPNPIRLGLRVELHDGSTAAGEVRSSLHAVQEEIRNGYRVIRIQPGERLKRDFVLRFRLGGRGIRSTLSVHPDPDGGEGTFALTVVPPGDAGAHSPRPRDIVFVLDRSGSMGGWKMVAARRAVARMIDTLTDADRFGVLAFDSTIESPDDRGPVFSPATDRNRFRAVEFLARVDARGGTEMAEPLDRAVKLLGTSKEPDAGRDRILVLITDGQVGNEDQVLRKLGKRLSKLRVFTIGIDHAVNEGFLRRLAERGGGSCELVESEDRLDEAMDAIHRRIGTPLLTGLSLHPEGLAIEPGEVVPRRLPDLFPGSPLLVLGRYRGHASGEIAVRGLDAVGTVREERVPVEVRENPAIASAWARGQVRQLEDRYASHDGDLATLEKTIVAISLRFGVLCRFTAYVAVDRSEVANPGSRVHRVTQPVELPAGFAAAMAPPPPFSPLPSRPVDFGFAAMPMIDEYRPSPPSSADESFSDLCEFALEDARFDEVFCLAEPPNAGKLSGPAEGTCTLADFLADGDPIDASQAATLVAEIAEAVQRLRDEGALRGDLDPERILINAATFRLVEIQPAAEVPITKRVARGKDSHRRSPAEVHSLGVILYRLLTGREPYPEAARARPGRARLIRPRRLIAAIPTELESLCLKALEGDAAVRYPDAGEFAAALRGFLQPRKGSFWK